MTDASPPRQPPRYVPTLTEVVPPQAIAEPPVSPVPAGPPSATAPVGSASALEEQLVQRVMLRVQQGLDQRLREAVAQVVLEQTRGIGPLVAHEVQAAVRELVADALAAERAR